MIMLEPNLLRKKLRFNQKSDSVLLPKWIDVFIFLYFLTLSAELIHFQIGLFKPRLNHAIALVLLCIICKYQKKWELDWRLAKPFLAVFASMFISCLFGEHFFRSFGYLFVYLYTILCYFVLPLALFQIYAREKLLKLYLFSFLVLGIYAFSQVFCSFYGLILPFVTQYTEGVARGQGWNYEPSYYALWMTQFVMYYNAYSLLETEKTFSWFRFGIVNSLLVISTSTGVVFSYPIFAVIYTLAGISKITSIYMLNVKKKSHSVSKFFYRDYGINMAIFPEAIY